MVKGREGNQIPEGQGRFPWWIWLIILVWLVYAFLIGPFELTGPGG
jgi:hypothetical protein